MSTALALADLNTTINHEPRVADLRLAEALGFERPRKIRELISRNQAALERFGSVCPTVGQTSAKGGRPGKTYWLTKRQALFICTKAETPNATDVTIQMVEVFDAYLAERYAPSPVLTPGTMPMMVAGQIVLVDTSEFVIRRGDRAVVCGHDGKIAIMRGPLEPSCMSLELGQRSVAGPWRKIKGQRGRRRSMFTVIGRLVADSGRLKMLSPA